MEISLVSGWIEFVSGQAAIYSFSLALLFGPRIEHNKLTADLVEGEWHGHAEGVDVLDKRTLEKRRFDIVLLSDFEVTKEDLLAGKKEVDLGHLYALALEFPEEGADQPRRMVIGTDSPATMNPHVPPGKRSLLLLAPGGTLRLSLCGPTGSGSVERLVVLNGPEGWRRVSFDE